MAKLIIVYDPSDPGMWIDQEKVAANVRYAHLPLADNLGELDIYEVAKKLAELLLEQLELEG